MKCFIRNVLIVFSLSLLVACERDEVVVKHVCEAVDLGLSVKWATCNIGAFAPEEFGCYFAWGEIKQKIIYDWSTYKYGEGDANLLTKYNDDSFFGIVDNKILLDMSDDAAHINWGGSWRIPTDAEWTELREQCTWTWTTQNGIKGYKVTSNKSGYTNNFIFLPVAGYCHESSFSGTGSYGLYWSSSLNIDYPYLAWYVNFDSSRVKRDDYNRNTGLSIRPVCL